MKKPIRVEWYDNYQEWAFLDPDNNWVGSIGADSGTLDKRAEQDAGEFIQAVNEHDDLLAQRAALVAACESVLESMDIATEGFGDSIANGMFKGAFLGVRKQTEAALALVKGDQKSDDATA